MAASDDSDCVGYRMDDMTPMRRLPRIPGRLAFWGLAAAALLVSHDGVWMLQVGPGQALAEAMRHAGHDYWGAASIGIAVVFGLVGFVTLRRLMLLRRHADAVGASDALPPRRRFLARVAAAWLRLAIVVAVGFVVQENVEHALSHGHMPGIGALLGPEYPLALPVIAAITMVAGVVAAAITGVEHQLLARIGAAGIRLRAPRVITRPHPRPFVAPADRLPHANAGRAPPPLLVQA